MQPLSAVTGWSAVVLALAPVGDDAFRSRLPAFLHPLAGRPLCWHALHAFAVAKPGPERLVLVTGVELSAETFRDLLPQVQIVAPRSPEAAHLFEDPGEVVLLADACAPTLADSVPALLAAPAPLAVGAEGRAPSAARVDADTARALLFAADVGFRWTEALPPTLAHLAQPAAARVRDRADFARAAVRVRDRLVRELMDAGVTFLLPETVLVDVDVQIGRDSVIYPGVVLEGRTTVGEETVIGPGSRIVESWIGSGVEMKGWNYISHTSVRNRAILEPYLRRGFD